MHFDRSKHTKMKTEKADNKWSSILLFMTTNVSLIGSVNSTNYMVYNYISKN